MGICEVRICVGRLSCRVLAGFCFQSGAEGLRALGSGPTVVVVAEGRYFAVSALVIVVGDSKTTKYLQVLVLI